MLIASDKLCFLTSLQWAPVNLVRTLNLLSQTIAKLGNGNVPVCTLRTTGDQCRAATALETKELLSLSCPVENQVVALP